MKEGCFLWSHLCYLFQWLCLELANQKSRQWVEAGNSPGEFSIFKWQTLLVLFQKWIISLFHFHTCEILLRIGSEIHDYLVHWYHAISPSFSRLIPVALTFMALSSYLLSALNKTEASLLLDFKQVKCKWDSLVYCNNPKFLKAWQNLWHQFISAVVIQWSTLMYRTYI